MPERTSLTDFAHRWRHHLGVKVLAGGYLWGGKHRVPVAYPPGHYYSPLPSAAEAAAATVVSPLAGIDVGHAEQRRLLAALAVTVPPSGPRYRVAGNTWFPATDAAVYQAMVRHFSPQRVIEVGAGFSTAALFDAGAAPSVSLIEPDPAHVSALLSPADLARCEVTVAPLQTVPLARFLALAAGDILFVDSTHVTKVGSDVNRLIFEILPALAPGVLVHFHDVFYPFEYPEAWRREGRGWNEAYLLRAFLQYNAVFRIVLWNGLLASTGDLPADGSSSLWLQKLAP